MKRRFWFWCQHEFSFPIRSSDGSYYQVCIHCGTEYGYDWKRMKRAKALPRRVQQTSLEQRLPEVKSVAKSPVLSTPSCAAPVSVEDHGKQEPATAPAHWAMIWSVVKLALHLRKQIASLAASVSNAAKGWAAAASRWGAANRRQLNRLAPVAALVVFLALAFVVVHRAGRAAREQNSHKSTAAMEVASHSEATIETAANNRAAPEAPPAPSESKRHADGKRLKRASFVQRVQTPVLVLGEALVTSQPNGAQVRFDGHSDPFFVTPAVVGSISPGRHSVVISKPGFVSQTVALDVVAGVRSTVTARLMQQGSVFKVSSNPAGAAILLDGKSTALTSPAELHVDAGRDTHDLASPLGFSGGAVSGQRQKWRELRCRV